MRFLRSDFLIYARAVRLFVAQLNGPALRIARSEIAQSAYAQANANANANANSNDETTLWQQPWVKNVTVEVFDEIVGETLAFGSRNNKQVRFKDEVLSRVNKLVLEHQNTNANANANANVNANANAHTDTDADADPNAKLDDLVANLLFKDTCSRLGERR